MTGDGSDRRGQRMAHHAADAQCQMGNVMPITSLYAGLLALLFVGLSARTLRLRRTLGIAVWDAGNEAMLRAMRAHSNFAEYVPLGLILFFLVEAGEASPWLVHGLGIALLIGRIAHAYGLSQVPEPSGYRVAGMALTLTPIVIAAISLVVTPILKI